MAIFRITPSTSVFNNLLPFPFFDTNAFDSDTAGADSLIVDPGAFLISVFGDGAVLAATGAWSVTVNGVVASETQVGINLAAGNTAVSTIKIGTDGGVQGGPVGIFLGSSANIDNAGTIVAQSGGIGIQIANSGTNTITNSGEINVSFTGFGIKATVTSNDTVHNSGIIDGIINLSDGNDTVTNSGHVFGDVMLGGGTNHLTNSGHAGIVFGGSGADTVTNSGNVEGVALGEGTNRLTNSGTVGDAGPGNSSFSGGGGADTVTNTGTIFSPVLLGEGNNTLTNSGKLVGLFGGVVGGGGNDTVTNSGTIGTDFAG